MSDVIDEEGINKADDEERPTSTEATDDVSRERSESNVFAARLRAIQADSADRIRNITSFFQQPDSALIAEATTLPEQDLYEKVETFLSDDHKIVTERRAESSVLINSINQLSSRYLAEMQAVSRNILTVESDKRLLELQITELRELEGWRKFTTSLRRRSLEAELKRVESIRREHEVQRSHIRDQLNALSDFRTKILDKVDRDIFAEVANNISVIASEYIDFAEDLASNHNFASEVEEAYISGAVTIEMQRQIKKYEQIGQPISPDLISQFFSELRDYVALPDEDKKSLSDPRWDHIFEIHGGFYELRNVCDHLRKRDGSKMIRRVCIELVAGDLRKIQNILLEVSQASNNGESINRFRFDQVKQLFKQTLSSLDRRLTKTESLPLLLERLNQPEEWGYPNLDLWFALKNSTFAQEVFGEFISQTDQHFYARALDKSLTDSFGDDITTLEHYPTPEAIRNLIVIAAADYKTYRTFNANRVLTNLALRSDWSNILSAAELQYPDLVKLRPVLVDWNFAEQTQHPMLRDHVDDFSDAIRSVDNQKLSNLAKEAMSNQALLALLVEEGALTQEESANITNAKTFIEDFEKKYWNEIREDDEHSTASIYSYHFFNAIRTNIILESTTPLAERAAIPQSPLRRLAVLSQELLRKRDDLEAVSFLLSEDVVSAMVLSTVKPELIFQFRDSATLLMDKSRKSTRTFIFQNGDLLINDQSDIRFLEGLVGRYGRNGDQLIREYHECLAVGSVTPADKELVLKFISQFRVITPSLFSAYKQAELSGTGEIFMTGLKSVAEKLTGSGHITDSEKNLPYFYDLLRHVYQNNIANYTTYESNESCSDRSADLSRFVVKPRYDIDLLSASTVQIKEGESPDKESIEQVKEQVFAINRKAESANYDNEILVKELSQEIDALLLSAQQEGKIRIANLSSVKTIEEKLFILMSESVYGSRIIDQNTLKSLILRYEFTAFEDIRDYISGTSDRVSRATNVDYALLCELHTFFSDRIKEVNRRIVEAGWNNPSIVRLMPDYFEALSHDMSLAQQQARVNRLQVGKLGMSDSFIREMMKILQKRNGRPYTADRVTAIVKRYESMTGGLPAERSTAANTHTKAFYGKLRSQRERTINAFREITGEELDPKTISLGAINMQQALETERSIRQGEYNDQQFAAYTVQRFIDIYEDERSVIETELGKYKSDAGREREILHGYISKAKETAHARMVGGVCVAGDNPINDPDKNMWDMPNYFQLVLQEPDSYRCQGLVLLHHFNYSGKKVLTASFNPSSTYLYSVDEKALYKGLLNVLKQFAADNNFDMIAVSNNSAIRTNRTGGAFEAEMAQSIAHIGKQFTFTPAEQFSYKPFYVLADMDIVWEKEPTAPSSSNDESVMLN